MAELDVLLFFVSSTRIELDVVCFFPILSFNRKRGFGLALYEYLLPNCFFLCHQNRQLVDVIGVCVFLGILFLWPGFAFPRNVAVGRTLKECPYFPIRLICVLHGCLGTSKKHICPNIAKQLLLMMQ